MVKKMDSSYMFIKYIQKTLINEKMNYIRNTKKKSLEIQTDEFLLQNIPSIDSHLLENLTLKNVDYLENFVNNPDLADALSQLNTMEKIIIYKKYVLGNTDFEIAKELNISSQAISKRKRKILKKMEVFFQ